MNISVWASAWKSALDWNCWVKLVAQTVKNLSAMQETLGLIPGLGRSSREENGFPPQYSCLGDPMDRKACWATVHGLKRIGHDWATNMFTFTRLLSLFKGAANSFPEWLHYFTFPPAVYEWSSFLTAVPAFDGKEYRFVVFVFHSQRCVA